MPDMTCGKKYTVRKNFHPRGLRESMIAMSIASGT